MLSGVVVDTEVGGPQTPNYYFDVRLRASKISFSVKNVDQLVGKSSRNPRVAGLVPKFWPHVELAISKMINYMLLYLLCM